jgi:dienelactone hydrolase
MNRMLMVCLFVFVVIAQLSAGAGRQFREEEVTFRSGNITLAGTVSIPSGTGSFPAVVLLSGSGPQNRDSELGGFRPFKLIAHDFARRGIAVLRIDDRGVGGSTGSLAKSTTEDLAGDALAAVRMLSARTDIDSRRIGLVGHSEGAAVAAIAASRSADVAFIAWLAGSAVSGAEIMRTQAEGMARAGGASPAKIEDILRHHDALMAAIRDEVPTERLTAIVKSLVTAQTGKTFAAPGAAPAETQADTFIAAQVAWLETPWTRFFVTFDPATVLARVTCPVFAAFGGLDVQIPAAQNRGRLEAVLKNSGHQQLTVRIYDKANHLFMPAVTGQLPEYATLPKEFVPSFLDDLAGWITGAASAKGASR